MKALILTVIAGSLGAGGAFAGDLRPPLNPGQLRPSISRPTLLQEYGVPSARPSAQPQTQGGAQAPSAAGMGWPTAPAGDASGGRTAATPGTAGAAVPGAGYGGGVTRPDGYGLPLGEGEGAIVRKAMGFDDGSRDTTAGGPPPPPGAAQGAIVRKAMGIDEVPGAATSGAAAPPGVAAGDVVRKSMGLDSANMALPEPNDDDRSGASTDAGKDGSRASDEPRPRVRGAHAAPPKAVAESRPSVDWEAMKSTLRTGVTSILGWMGNY